jgi:hypothetical protein
MQGSCQLLVDLMSIKARTKVSTTVRHRNLAFTIARLLKVLTCGFVRKQWIGSPTRRGAASIGSHDHLEEIDSMNS